MRRLLGRLAVIGLLSSAGSLAATSAASASIVIGQGVAGVKLGTSHAQVKAVLGPPPSSPFATEYFYEALDLDIIFKHGQVSEIQDYSKRQRASSGVRVGSYRAAVQHAYPGAKCVEGAPSILYCVVGAHFQGHASYTGFLFEHPDGPIVEVETGFGSVAQALKHP
jgi:hypothetical protein